MRVRRRREGRDMILLGGWLFADLLLGLAMLFLTANTVGTPPPTPTPTPSPNSYATMAAEAAMTATAQQAELDALNITATAVDQRAAATAAAHRPPSKLLSRSAPPRLRSCN